MKKWFEFIVGSGVIILVVLIILYAIMQVVIWIHRTGANHGL